MLVPAKTRFDGGFVHQVHVVELGCLAAEFGDPAEGFLAGVHQVVDDDHVVAGFLQGQEQCGNRCSRCPR